MMMMTIIPPFTLWGSVKNGETRKAHRENIYSFALSLSFSGFAWVQPASAKASSRR